MEFPNGRKIVTNGIELVIHEAGSGIPVVLAHGFPELAYSWRHQIEPLVKAGYRVIVPDQRGYGDSDKPQAVAAYDIHQLCADHAGLLDALGIDQAVFVGHDWGAIVVWQMALLHPQRVAGVAGLSVPFTARPPADPLLFWEQALGPDFYIVHFNRQPGVAADAFSRNVERFLRNLYRAGSWTEEAGDFAAAGRNLILFAEQENTRGEPIMSEADLAVFVDAFEKGGFHAPCNWYRNFSRNWATTAAVEQRVRQPALMLYGEHDMVPRNPDMGLYITDLETHTLPCGHWIQQEQPLATNRILLDWLDRRMRPLF